MKKNVLALSIAAMVAGFAGSAYAVTDLTAAANVTATTATAQRFSNTGIGHSLLVPYFSSQGGNMTLLALTNTDQKNGKAVKVRFRGAQNSDDLRDFQVFLSPGDVWTGAVVQGADGRSTLISSDNSCTKPVRAQITVPFGTSRLNPAATDAEKAAGTREGYVEIFNMADIPPHSDGLGLYTAIKHPANGAPACGNIAANAITGVPANKAWTAIDGTDLVPDLTYDQLTTTTAANTVDTTAASIINLANPTTGLMANWTIINVPKALSWTGTAAAVEAVADLAVAAVGTNTGALVYYPQTDRPAGTTQAAIDAATADPLLTVTGVADKGGNAIATPAISALKVDLPDMSTPYIKAGAALVTPSVQAAALATSIATLSLSNEFWSNPDISGATDWVMSMPTRRYAMAVNYKMPITSGIPEIYNAAGATTAPARVFNTNNNGQFAPGNTKLTGSVACVSGIDYTLYDREENALNRVGGGVVVSPAEPGAKLLFCGETAVVAFNSVGTATSPVLSAGVTVSHVDGSFKEGWANLVTPGATAAKGLPILGSAFSSAYNPSVAAGTSGNYSLTWEHRYVRP